MDRAGPAAWLAPAAGLTLGAAAAGAARAVSAPEGQPHVLLMTALEALLPLAAANAAVTLVARDPFREIQLTLPTSYRATLLRRLAVLAASTTAAATGFVAVLVAADRWDGPPYPSPSAAASPAVWAVPVLWLTGLALLVALTGRSVALAVSLTSGVWVAEAACYSYLSEHALARPWLLFVTSRTGAGPDWAGNRLTLGVCGALMCAVAVKLLDDRERLVTEEEV